MQRFIQIITTSILSLTLFIPSTVPAFALEHGFGAVNRASIASDLRDSVKPTIEAKISGTLQKRASQELSRRIDALKKVLNRINEIKHLTTDQRTTLTTQVQQEIDSLTALQT